MPSGLCVQPLRGGSAPADNTTLVLAGNCGLSRPEIQFTLTRERLLRHISSGKCAVPLGLQDPVDNTNLVLLAGSCDPYNPIMYMAFVPQSEGYPVGILQHGVSGPCVHPSGSQAKPPVGTPLVFRTGLCDLSLSSTILFQFISGRWVRAALRIYKLMYVGWCPAWRPPHRATHCATNVHCARWGTAPTVVWSAPGCPATCVLLVAFHWRWRILSVNCSPSNHVVTAAPAVVLAASPGGPQRYTVKS